MGCSHCSQKLVVARVRAWPTQKARLSDLDLSSTTMYKGRLTSASGHDCIDGMGQPQWMSDIGLT